MKVNENCIDRLGRPYFVFSGYRSIDDVYQWLNLNGYNGYKFGIVLDCTPEELREPDRNYYVYFLDELADEVMSYCDFYKQDKDTYKSKYAKER